MAEKTFNLEIDGYWLDGKTGSIPDCSGVYFVYECTYDISVKLHRLIYLGESESLLLRIENHERYKEWQGLVRKGNMLCFSICEIEAADRNRVEAAYIFKHQPLLNVEYKNSFPYDKTTVQSKNEPGMLNTDFMVVRT